MPALVASGADVMLHMKVPFFAAQLEIDRGSRVLLRIWTNSRILNTRLEMH